MERKKFISLMRLTYFETGAVGCPTMIIS